MAETTLRIRDQQRVHTDTADIDVSESDYTNYINLLEVAPPTGHVLRDVRLVFDLAKASTGFAAGHTTQTIQFALARKVDGTNWRIDAEKETSTISGTNAASRSITLEAGDVGSDEDLRVYVKLSAENSVDVELPFVCYYRGESATFTPVAAG